MIRKACGILVLFFYFKNLRMSQIKIKYVGIDFFKDSSFNEDFIKNECYKIFSS